MSDPKNLREVVELGVSVANAVSKAMEDGKISFVDIADFLDSFGKLGPALKDIGNVPAELKQMDAADYAALSADFSSSLALSSAKLEEALQLGFQVGLQILQLVEKLKV